MAFEIANEAFEKAFGKSGGKGEKELLDSFMEMLNKYLAGRKEWTAAAIRGWLRKGGTLCTFRCREDVVQPLIDDMVDRRIPFVLVKSHDGTTGFLIRETDTLTARTSISNVLKNLSGYCEITTGEQAGIIYRKAKSKDKTMLLLCGLSETEIYYLEEEAKATLPGKAIGLDRMSDGTFMLTCHGRSIFEEKSRFCESLMEARLIANGETADSLAKRRKKREEYIKEKTAGFPDKEGSMDSPVWIVGNGDKYVKRGPDGFEAGHAEEVAGEVFLSKELDVPLSDSAYERRMNSALAKITGHICLYSIQDVLEHFRSKKNFIRDAKETGQQKLIRSASAIVMEKTAKENGKRLHGWKKRIDEYQQNMGILITAAKEGKIPSGYTKTDILRLRRIMRTFGLDMNKAERGLERMSSLQIYEREAGPARVEDIEKLLAVIRGEDVDMGIDHTSRDIETGLEM